MRSAVHRFVDWMEAAPTYKTIWFLPLVFVLYLYSVIKNSLKGSI